MKLRLLTKGELVNKADQLYEELLNRREEKKRQLIKQGFSYYKDNRVPFEFIDMDDLEKELMLVLANFHCKSGYRYSAIDKKVILKVVLAAMCQLIKSPFYTKSYRQAYKEVTGLEANNKFYLILEETYISEGVLPSDWEALKGTTFRYKDVLVNEAGIPNSLINDIIDFFLLYWKYFKGRRIDEVFNELSKTRLNNTFKYEYGEFNKLNDSYKVIKEYPRKVSRVITQLSEVCSLLESGEYSADELNDEEIIESINQVLSFDMFRILPRKDSLKSLYNKILNHVTPDKFKRIINCKPGELKITTPSLEYIKICNYDEIQLGEHRIINITYNVVLDKRLSINQIINWNYDELIVFNESIGFRSKTYFKVTYGKYREGTIYPLYINGCFEGYYWLGIVPEGLPLKIGANIIPPKEPIHYNIHFKYYYNKELSTYGFKISMTDIRLYIPEYKNRQLTLKCNFSSDSKDFMLDQSGSREIEKFDFNINFNMLNEQVIFDLYLKESNEHVLLKQLLADKLEPIYCFSKIDKNIVPPGEHLYGNTDFLICLSPSCNNDIKIDSQTASIKEYPTNILRIYKVTWINNRIPLEFSIGKLKWLFREPLIFYLRDNRYDNFDDEFEEESIKEYASLDLVSYELITNLSETELNRVYLVIFYGEGKYRELRLASIMISMNGIFIVNGEVLRKKVGLDINFIGKLTLSFVYNQKMIYENVITIFPTIKVEETQKLYLEGETVNVKLVSDVECFYENGLFLNTISKILGTAIVNNENNILKAETLAEEMFIPSVDKFYNIKYIPNILFYRLIDNRDIDNRYILLKTVDYDDLNHYIIYILSRSYEKIELVLNSYKQELRTNESGTVKCSLSNFKDKIVKSTNKLKIICMNKSISIMVKWEPKIYSIIQLIHDVTTEVGFEIDYEGPNDINLLINLVDTYGNIISHEKLKFLGRRTKLVKSYDVPSTYKDKQILINISYESDEDSLISQFEYNIIDLKWYNSIELYSKRKFISEIMKYSSITGDFVKKLRG